MVGQKLIVGMAGTTLGENLRNQIERGEVGGVLLFPRNIRSEAQLVALTADLQAAASAGGQPPLLIAVDQEGGTIRRIPWIPPTMSATDMGRLGDPQVARDQGAATGEALRALGINVDLAPVADVPAAPNSFMVEQQRTWSFNADLTAVLSDAFAAGLESAGVIPVVKHFPGIGQLAENTDTGQREVTASASALANGLIPFQRAIAHGTEMIMLSNATYRAYDRTHAAGWSPAIAGTLLRGELGFDGVTITDSLDAAAGVQAASVPSLAILSSQAGVDIILSTATATLRVRELHSGLLQAAQSGAIPRELLEDSYRRILALKLGLDAVPSEGLPEE
jgi:beta-N-acetylhexosaminidase